MCVQVIDTEIQRRKLLEATPIACRNEDPVNFDTSEIPWWAWVRRFHLPEVCLLVRGLRQLPWKGMCRDTLALHTALDIMLSWVSGELLTEFYGL